jgi:hypothetical protein
VPSDRLIDQTWGERPPVTSRDLLYGLISDVRRALNQAVAGVATFWWCDIPEATRQGWRRNESTCIGSMTTSIEPRSWPRTTTTTTTLVPPRSTSRHQRMGAPTSCSPASRPAGLQGMWADEALRLRVPTMPSVLIAAMTVRPTSVDSEALGSVRSRTGPACQQAAVCETAPPADSRDGPRHPGPACPGSQGQPGQAGVSSARARRA